MSNVVMTNIRCAQLWIRSDYATRVSIRISAYFADSRAPVVDINGLIRPLALLANRMVRRHVLLLEEDLIIASILRTKKTSCICL